MKKYFISQPMTGLTNEEIWKKRDKVTEHLMSLGEIEVLDSFIDDEGERHPLWYLGKALEELSRADVIYMVDGWKDSKGCRIEYLCARQYGIEIEFEEPEFLRDINNLCPPYMEASIRG